ncbi:MAG: histidyl-tRNA synthetase [Pseudohongiellaceae bacterium]|jgi:histidyl-tRNA synthetase
MAKIQAIRGMNDILPAQILTWQYLEEAFKRVVSRYAYQEIRFPIVEQTQLFKRSIGEVTDIVEKEMYSFDDRNGDNLSLRPEGTAVCVRAADQHGLLYNQQQRLWYHGPMFRHERPQKGRYRQFHQFGVEAFGMPGPDIDAEVISVSHALWQELDILDHLGLEINNIGSSQDRKNYAAALTKYLELQIDELDEDAKRRMYSNPMRVLDSKNSKVQAALHDAPKLADFVGQSSTEHYVQLKQLLDAVGISYIENAKLVRGLDYYNNCVFEWTTDILGAQSAVCGGGRYDGLVEQLGGKPTLAAGFAIGEERIVLMLDELGKVPVASLKPIDLYVVTVGDGLTAKSLQLTKRLRERFPHLGILHHCGGGKFNAQLKRAYASGADVAVILEQADNEVAGVESVKIRRLDDAGDTETVDIAEIEAKLAEFLSIS